MANTNSLVVCVCHKHPFHKNRIFGECIGGSWLEKHELSNFLVIKGNIFKLCVLEKGCAKCYLGMLMGIFT